MARVKARVGTTVARMPGVHSELRDVAENIAGAARGIAPVRTGNYKSSIRVEVDSGSPSRGDALAVAEASYSSLVEWGYTRGKSRVGGHHVMSRAAESVAG